jgi:hypothetical protein
MHKLSLRSTKGLNDSAREEAALEVDVEVPILCCTSLEGSGLLSVFRFLNRFPCARGQITGTLRHKYTM